MTIYILKMVTKGTENRQLIHRQRMQDLLMKHCSKMAIAVTKNYGEEGEGTGNAMYNETYLIKDYLRRLNEQGFLTTSSQPAIYDFNHGGVPFTNHCLTHRYQRAYVSGLMLPTMYERLIRNIKENNVLNVIQHTGHSTKVYGDKLEEDDEVLVFKDKPFDDDTWFGLRSHTYYMDIIGLEKELMESLMLVMIQDRMPLAPTYSCDLFWETLITSLSTPD